VLAVVPAAVWRAVPRRLEAADAAGALPPASLATRALARMPLFWATALVYALGAGIAAGWTGQLGPFLGARGLGERDRAAVVALQFWAGIPGTLLFGALAERFRATPLFAGILLFQALAFSVYALGAPAGWTALFAVASGFAGGGLVPLFSLLLGQRVGAQAVGRAMGIANLLFLPCTVGAISLASTVYDRGGDYRPAQLAFATGMLLALAALLLSERGALRQARAAA
jgi:cyanate permease